MATPQQGTPNQRQTITTRVGGRCSELSSLWDICRETVEHMFFHCREIKAAYSFWFVLANKCMSPTGTVPAITKLTCADMVIEMKEQPRSATTNTLPSMLLYSIWITRNKTVHREGLCDREGTVAIKIQLYFYSYLKSCIKLDYQVAKIKNKLTDFRKIWAGLCQISDSNSLHFLYHFKNLWKILKSYKRLL